MQSSSIFLFRVLANGSLLITAASPDDEGEYECRASNKVGPGLSRSIGLSVIGEKYQQENGSKQTYLPEAAHFREPTATYHVRVGEEASLKCDPEGDQPITVYWSRNGSKIDPQHHHDLKVARLFFDL